MTSQNALLSQKLCHYFHEGGTLHGFHFRKSNFSLNLLKAFEY